MLHDVTSALDAMLRLLAPVRDILDGRVEDVEPPAWCTSRGWDGLLLALDDDELGRCEAEGLAARAAALPDMPEDLRALAAGVLRETRLPELVTAPHAMGAAGMRQVSARKQQQLPALLEVVAPMAERAARIVDVGSGSGHFTRLSSMRFDRAAVGIARDPDRVAAAEERARTLGAGATRFVAADACQEPLDLSPGDLAVGLHACGDLGDQLVVAAAKAGCDVALVSCCLQKIAAPARTPLSRAAAQLTLRRQILGLANLTSQASGVETSIKTTMAARETRYALLRLLRERGVEVAPGEEMRGINRRRARAGLRELAALALARRGLREAGEAELSHHQQEARLRYAVVRRLSLPRSMLARLVEIAVVLDRAAALEEHGAYAVVGTLFERAASPRNIALLASRKPLQGVAAAPQRGRAGGVQPDGRPRPVEEEVGDAAGQAPVRRIDGGIQIEALGVDDRQHVVVALEHAEEHGHRRAAEPLGRDSAVFERLPGGS